MTDLSIPVSYLTSDRTSSTATTQSNDTLDSQAFLQLLIAQLKNQDPSSPTDTSTILTQTTQLAQMEGMAEQTAAAQASFALQQDVAATSLVGRTVTWKDGDDVTQSGVVSTVSFYSAGPQLRVGDTDIALGAVLTVAPTD
jgi:flagellar basal-body rod modification protein FlgD